MPIDTVITAPEKQFSLVAIPAGHLPNGIITEFEDLRDKTVIRNLFANAPCTAADFRSVAQAIPTDKRAMTVKIANDAGNGFLVPGSRVDIVASMPDPDDAKKMISRVLLQNVQVLATGHDSEVGTTTFKSILTLAVAPEDVANLAGAAATSQLTAVLRKPEEK